MLKRSYTIFVESDERSSPSGSTKENPPAKIKPPFGWKWPAEVDIRRAQEEGTRKKDDSKVRFESHFGEEKGRNAQ